MIERKSLQAEIVAHAKTKSKKEHDVLRGAWTAVHVSVCGLPHMAMNLLVEHLHVVERIS